MRILYLLTTLGIGGAEKQVVDLAERLSAKGHIVALVVLKHTEEEWPASLPILRLNLRKTPLGIWRGLRFARGFLAPFRPDILHSHTFPANLFTRMLAMFLSERGSRIPVVNTVHNVYEGGWLRMALYRLTDFLVHQVTAVSAAAADRFVRMRAVPASKMLVLTNGIDTDAFQPDRARRRRMRSEFGVGNRFLWLAVGRLAAAKDYPNLLRAFGKVRSLQSTVEIWIAGEGDFSHFSPSGELDEQPEGVRFLGLRRDIADLLDVADGFVLASAWEGMPLAIAEAMSMEKVVVATDVGGVRELVGSAGIVVPAHDSTALAEAMLHAMKLNDMERKSMARDARKRVQMHYSIGAKAEQWEGLYQGLLQRKTDA